MGDPQIDQLIAAFIGFGTFFGGLGLLIRELIKQLQAKQQKKQEEKTTKADKILETVFTLTEELKDTKVQLGQLQSITDELARTRISLETANKKIGELETVALQVAELRAQIDSLTAQVLVLQNESQAKDERSAADEAMIRDLKTRLSERDSEIETLNQQLVEFQSQLTAQQEQSEQRSNAFTKVSQELAAVKRDFFLLVNFLQSKRGFKREDFPSFETEVRFDVTDTGEIKVVSSAPESTLIQAKEQSDE